MQQLESLDLTYNPVLMRDKENRRNLVYFLHNRLHHFQLFNGLHINTLFSRVSCGNDYLEDIIDVENASPHFFVPPRHVMTIGMKKNLLGRPRHNSELTYSEVTELPMSPFCLDERQLPESPILPHTPTFSLRVGQRPHPAVSEDQCLHSTAFSSKEGRGRSMSMFESLSNRQGEEKKPQAPEEERRTRTYSVHDVILQSRRFDFLSFLEDSASEIVVGVRMKRSSEE